MSSTNNFSSYYMPQAAACNIEQLRQYMPCKDFYLPGFWTAYAHTIYISCMEQLYIDAQTAKELHRRLNLGLDFIHPGEYRNGPASLSGGYQFASPDRVPSLMEQFTEYAQESLLGTDYVCAAACIHQRLVDIHPFQNGNGRVARLLMNSVLLHFGDPPLWVTSDWRADYSLALGLARSGEDKCAFINLIRKHVINNKIKLEGSRG